MVTIAYNKRTHRNGELRAEHTGQTVTLVGWVNTYRDHGGMVFIDLRDYQGVTQLKFNPQTNPETHRLAGTLRSEDVIAVVGQVVSRDEHVNPNIPTGDIEVEVRELDVLSKSETPPFDLNEAEEVSEELRLRYRYLDLRRPAMQKNMRLRARIARAIRDYFDDAGFVEVETPFMTKSTPEGARDYLVPSRVQPGSFYALPQSPQLFKQLYMIAGFDRYAQIVRCFRDEDLRADRQPEFTQLDMEMAFVQAEDIMREVEACVKQIFQRGIDHEISLPIPRMSYAEAMERFGIDRPDVRFGMELQNVTEVVRGCEFKVFADALANGGIVKCLVAPGASRLTRKQLDGLTEEIKGIGGAGLPYVKVGGSGESPEFSTGIAKFVQPVAKELCAQTRAAADDIIFFMPGTFAEVSKYLHHLRTLLAEMLDLIPANEWKLLWVTEFPLFEWHEEEGRFNSTHHPFTAPVDEDIPLFETDAGRIRAKAYDLVLNGVEMGGGSIRIHQQDIQKKVFKALGIGEAEAREKFQFLMEALSFGAPPHGGIAFGFDRWAMVLAGQTSLRDVIAFPKTARAVCPLTGAPSSVDEAQLRELGLAIRHQAKAPKSEVPTP